MAPCFGGEKEAVQGISMGLPKHILGKMKSLWKGVGAWAEKFITEEMQGECGGAEGTRTVWVSLYQETECGGLRSHRLGLDSCAPSSWLV